MFWLAKNLFFRVPLASDQDVETEPNIPTRVDDAKLGGGLWSNSSLICGLWFVMATRSICMAQSLSLWSSDTEVNPLQRRLWYRTRATGQSRSRFNASQLIVQTTSARMSGLRWIITASTRSMHDVKRRKQNSRPVKTVTESPLSSFAAGVFWGLHCMLSLSHGAALHCMLRCGNRTEFMRENWTTKW